MRMFTTSAVAVGAALLVGLGSVSPSFAKAHDNGRGQFSENTPPGQMGQPPGQADDRRDLSFTSENAPGKGETPGLGRDDAPGQNKND